MAAEEDFVLSFTGEETDNLLKHTESMKNQTTEEDGETVQVYDTNGVPHKVSKTELLKKSTLALPALEDISSFVAVNAAGNAVGVMTKEQVASVLAGLIPFPFTRRMYINDANKDVESGYYRGNSSNLNTPVKYGILIVFSTIESYIVQLLIDVTSIRLWGRGSIDNGNSWTEWTQIGG
mgnify:CR=1 FL=1|jgi:hypothetical protein